MLQFGREESLRSRRRNPAPPSRRRGDRALRGAAPVPVTTPAAAGPAAGCTSTVGSVALPDVVVGRYQPLADDGPMSEPPDHARLLQSLQKTIVSGCASSALGS